MKEKEQQYIELLLNKCLNFKKSKSLFIDYEKAVNEKFVYKVCEYAKNMGINDIYLNDEASYHKHDILKNVSLKNIAKESLFNNVMWDEYAKKNASFLIIESEIPGLMKDIDSEKIAEAKKVSLNTKQLYKQKQLTDDISWCICAYPNEIWAKDIFGNVTNAYELLFDKIMEMCMCDKGNAITNWNNYLDKTKKLQQKINDLKITKLHYTNNLGTNLYIELPENHVWSSAFSEKEMLVNMPSYEIFSSPKYDKTEGIIYASKPLIYNGVKINDFWLKFAKGKVVDFDAKEGKEILKGIINTDDQSCYLGECALVNYDSPISNTKIVFNTTLIDENASCHLALGNGFPECIKDYEKYKKEELFKMGINYSKNHVDFMVGTKDLTIEAETKENTKIFIFKNGNFVI